MIWHGMAWNGMVRYGMKWYNGNGPTLIISELNLHLCNFPWVCILIMLSKLEYNELTHFTNDLSFKLNFILILR